MSAAEPPDDSWVEKHYARLRQSAWLLSGRADVADDLAQETFARAIDGWHRFEGRSEVSTWLYSILLRLHARRLRTAVRATERIRRWLEIGRTQHELNDDPAARLASKHWRESLWAEVAKLPARQQQVVLLRFAEGFTYQQIAEACQIPVGTAKTRLHSALQRLRERHCIQMLKDSQADAVEIPTEVTSIAKRPIEVRG